MLANVAHQRFELRDFFSSFNRDLANCAPRRDYGLPAKIAGSRYLRTLMPIVSGLLGAVIALNSGAGLAFSPGDGGDGSSPPGMPRSWPLGGCTKQSRQLRALAVDPLIAADSARWADLISTRA